MLLAWWPLTLGEKGHMYVCGLRGRGNKYKGQTCNKLLEQCVKLDLGLGSSPPPPATPTPHTPSNYIAGRPKAALLFWFFGDIRCGALLFMVILVIYKYKIGKNSC